MKKNNRINKMKIYKNVYIINVQIFGIKKLENLDIF